MLVSIRVRSLLVAAAGALWLSGAAPPLAAQEATGTLEGTVTDAASQRPIANAQVAVIGTRFGALTTAQGMFRIPNVPVGQVRITVRMIGFAPSSQSATITQGQATRVDFGLEQSAIELSDVVVTGTGGAVEQKVLGNTVATVNLADLETAPIQSPTEILQGRVPGVAALPSGGLTGEGARIRIRGNASLSQSNEAIVYVDGVRADNGGGFGDFFGGVGGSPSRLDDLDPESIEKVEILKGAAAATLYGTEASNGVIQIFTKRGQAGAPRWSFRAEQSFIRFPDRIHPQAGFAGCHTQTVARPDANNPGETIDSLCTATSFAQDEASRLSDLYGLSIAPYQVFERNFPDDMMETGQNQTLSAQVSGGTQSVTYFVSGRYFNEDGPFSSDDPAGFRDGNARDESRLYQGTANINLFPRDNLRFSARMLYADRHHDTPGSNNNIYAPFTLAQFGKPELSNCNESDVAGGGRCIAGGNMHGNAAFSTTREALQERIYQDATHFNGVLSGAFNPTASLTLDATFGIDNTNARSVSFLPFGNAVDNFSQRNPNGERTVDIVNTQNITLDAKGTWSTNLMPELTSSFVFGGQGFITRRELHDQFSQDFPGPGLEDVGAGDAAFFLLDERFLKIVNAGVFAQEQLGWNDWLFATVGARFDRNSAFGDEAGGELYPKASVSAVLSDRPGWSSTLLSTLRLRAAYGKSGRQPGAFDKLTTYTALGGGLAPDNLGNPELAPEVSTEIEVGSELGLFNNLLGVQLTYWDRKVKDALVPVQFPLTGGFLNRQLANVGEITANGWEIGVNAFLINQPDMTLDVFANGAYLKQKVTSLGGAAALKVGGSYPRYRNFLQEGFEPGALLGAKNMAPCSSYADATAQACLQPGQLPYDLDGNGTPDSEAELLAFFADPTNAGVGLDALNPLRADDDGDGDFLDHYAGKPYPDWQGGFGANFRFLRNWRIGTLFEYKAGNYIVTNLTDAFRQANPLIGRNIREVAEMEALINNPASTPEQKLQVAKDWLGQKALSPYDGLNQDDPGDFIRWRELSLTYTATERLASVLRAQDVAFTFGVRNLALWTKYPGTDPEINAVGRGSGEGGVDEDFLDAVDAFGFPLTRRFTLSVRLSY